MRKSAVATTALSLAIGCGGALFLTGCDGGQRSADNDARTKDDSSEADRIKANTTVALLKVEQDIDTIAAQPGLSEEWSIAFRGRQAGLRPERITLMLSQLRGKEIAITNDIDDLEQLAMQLAGAQSS